jgi:hypothetical protein
MKVSTIPELRAIVLYSKLMNDIVEDDIFDIEKYSIAKTL